MTNRKIFYIPQFSMNDGKRAFICNDGNFIVLKMFVKHFIEYSKRTNEKIHIICCLPPTYSSNDSGYVSQKDLELFVGQIRELCERDTGVFVQFILSRAFPISPIESRFTLPFEFNDLKRLFKQENFDLIVNNIPEITKNLYAFLPQDSKCKIISFFHFCEHLFSGNHLTNQWIHGKIGYDQRQFDALLCSDYSFMNSASEIEECKKSITNALQPFLAKNLINQIDQRLNYLSYVDFNEYEKLAMKDQNEQTNLENSFGSKYGVFPARITESGYTNWQYVFEIYKDTKYPIVFCNPSGKKGIDCIRKLYPTIKLDTEVTVQFQNNKNTVTDVETCEFIKIGENIFIAKEPLSKSVYYAIGEYATFLVNMYVHEKYGGIGIRELYAINSNNQRKAIPIVPNVGEFRVWNTVLFETLNDPFFCQQPNIMFNPSEISDDFIKEGKDRLFNWISIANRANTNDLNETYRKIKEKENWNKKCDDFCSIIKQLIQTA